MGYNLELKTYLLPLAKKPPGLVSMAQWRPFKDGSTLGIIIDNFNRRSVSFCEKLQWLAEHIEKWASVIQVKERDLSTIDQLRIKDFANLDILLVDVDTLDTQSQVFRDLCIKMAAAAASRRQPYDLPQVSQNPTAESKASAFRPLPVHPSPVVMWTQEQFDQYLDDLHGVDSNIINSMPKPEPWMSKQAVKKYVRSIPNLVREIRGTAVLEKLSDNQIAALAKKVGIHELSLREIGVKIQSISGNQKVILSGIRKSVPTMSLELSEGRSEIDFEDAKLLQVRLKNPLASLSEEQRNVLGQLGVRSHQISAVHFDNQNIRSKLPAFSDDVEVKRFSAKPPRFDIADDLSEFPDL